MGWVDESATGSANLWSRPKAATSTAGLTSVCPAHHENVRATLLLVKEFAARHDGRPGGRVVLMTSGQHRGPMAREVAYAVSKDLTLGSMPMPHFRMPALDHEVVSLVWAIVLGAFVYFGSVAVGIHSGTAFVVSALAAFFIFLFVRYFGDDLPAEE